MPKSAKLIKEDNEYALYAVTILRGHYTAGYFTDGVFTAGTLISFALALSLSPIAERLSLIFCLFFFVLVRFLR